MNAGRGKTRLDIRLQRVEGDGRVRHAVQLGLHALNLRSVEAQGEGAEGVCKNG